MTFQAVSTRILSPAIPGLSLPSNIWLGQGPDQGLYVYGTNNSTIGIYVMTRGDWTYRLKVDSTVYLPVFNDINGYIYWKATSGSNYFYYTKRFGWVLHNQFPGYEPVEIYDSETRKYSGDAFHSGSPPTMRDDASSNLQPRGTNRNDGGANKTITFYFPRWKSTKNTLFGEYEPVIDVTETKFIGLPRWLDNYSRQYVRSYEKISGYYTYGEVRYFGGKWVIGTPGNPAGWWEGAEPSKTSAVTFRFCKPEDSLITGSNRVLSLYDYVAGDNNENGYFGEAAIWR